MGKGFDIDTDQEFQKYVERTESTHPGWKWENGKGWVYTPPYKKKQTEVNMLPAQNKLPEKVNKECDCGTDSAFERTMPIESHSQWCARRK